VFGGDAELSSPSTSLLSTAATIRSLSGTSASAEIAPGAIELFSANPFIDFKNAAGDDFDARIIWDYSTGAGYLWFYGAPMKFSTLEAHGGAAFPASPATNDLFYRTDLAMWFFYDATRWNCTCKHLGQYMYDGTMPLSASGSARLGLVGFAGSGLNLLILYTSFYVAGGTALSASHKWVGTVGGGGGGGTVITIDSGASDTWRSAETTIAALLGTNLLSQIDWVKTGTPGTLYALSTISYRIVAT